MNFYLTEVKRLHMDYINIYALSRTPVVIVGIQQRLLTG